MRVSASVSYSVFMMHRRKDLWGPDGELRMDLNSIYVMGLNFLSD